MLKEVTTEKTGNDRFEGFAIDLIDELSKLLGFKYEFILQEDRDYGVQIEGTEKWTGMLGAVMEDVSSLQRRLRQFQPRKLTLSILFIES